jgi:transposase
MRAELEEEPSEPSDDLVEALLPKSTWPVMRMETRSILKSLGVKYTTHGRPLEVIRKVGGGENFIADKGYDSEKIRQQACDRGMNPVIPRKSNSKKPNPEFDKHLYKMRHLVENLFARLKHYRSITTRFEKLARNYKSMVYLACSIIWIKVGR